MVVDRFSLQVLKGRGGGRGGQHGSQRVGVEVVDIEEEEEKEDDD